jgi:transcriptional regulator with XRE-family HTH domain
MRYEDPQVLVRRMREAAALSQRELAARANTSQSVVARIESGQTSPSWETLARLLAAAGAVPHLRVEQLPVVAPEWLADVDRIRALTPEDRLREVANLSAFTSRAVKRG